MISFVGLSQCGSPTNIIKKTMKTNIKTCLFILLSLMTFSCSTSKKTANNKEKIRYTATAPDYEQIKKDINS